MGACGSRVAAETTADWTTKVILPDGGILEYAVAVTAGGALGKHAAEFFVCDADEMEFNGYVPAVGAKEGLRRGQLYFVLPRSMLRRPLQAEDLAALALKASAAMVGAGVLVFPEKAAERAGSDGGKREERAKKRTTTTTTTKRGGGAGGRKFEPELSIIAE